MRYLLITATLLSLFELRAQTNEQIILPTNFHVVEEGKLYRSGQPNAKEMAYLESMGVKTILNLRYRINNRHEMRHTFMQNKRLKLKAQSIIFEDMVAALKIIQVAEKPILVHCLHGSDRTGCVVACYRMVFQNWSKEAAIQEFLLEEMGYNYRWFPNLLVFLETVDVVALRKKIGAD